MRGEKPHWAPEPEHSCSPRFVAVINPAHPERNEHTTASIPSPRHPGESSEVHVVRFAEEADGEILQGHVLLKMESGREVWWLVRT